MVDPIKPIEAKKNAKCNIPDFVIQGVNEAIKEHYRKGGFSIKQNEIIEFVLKFAPEGTTRKSLFDNNWLDFEDIFNTNGWIITYDKPAYYENYEPFFEFKEKSE